MGDATLHALPPPPSFSRTGSGHQEAGGLSTNSHVVGRRRPFQPSATLIECLNEYPIQSDPLVGFDWIGLDWIGWIEQGIRVVLDLDMVLTQMFIDLVVFFKSGWGLHGLVIAGCKQTVLKLKKTFLSDI